MPRRKPKPQERRGRAPRAPLPDPARAAEALQRRRDHCLAKARYVSEAEARAHALMHAPGPGRRTQAYLCDVCGGWHLTRG